jgi:uncharacterized membrane protein YraQ (UPF0718 family)
MSDVLSTIGEGLEQSFLMAYEVWWALVLGFAISAIVQAWVPRHRIESALAGGGLAPVAKATGLGAASSSCSYAARGVAKALFPKGGGGSPSRSSRRVPRPPRPSPSSLPRPTWSGSWGWCSGS